MFAGEDRAGRHYGRGEGHGLRHLGGACCVSFAGQQRLPGVYAYRELVDAGGLMS
jgi:hypothetical protein